MTSGQFTTFPLDHITVDREARQRRELSGISELALSLKQVGLINPIVIERSGNLRAGERRFSAAKMLGWTHIPVQFVDELDEATLQQIELEENIRRQALDWKDECLAIERYHKLRSNEDGWNTDKTAEALGVSPQTLSSKRAVARELSAGNERVLGAPKYSVALGIVDRARQRRESSALDRITAIRDEADDNARHSPDDAGNGEVSAGTGIHEASEARPHEGRKAAPIVCEDFIAWQKAYVGEPFNFIHCDFPYGVNADKHDQGASSSFGGYEDSPEVYWNLIAALKEGMENVVAESAHIMFWFSMDYYTDTLAALRDMGWSVDPFPLIWWKSDNSGILPDPSRGPRRVYETCFFGSRGDRKIVRAVSNLFGAPNLKSLHMSEKNLTMLTKFMGMFVDEYSIVLDPTCGSGSSLKAAASCGAARVLGLEINEEFAAIAKDNFYDDED